MASQRPSTLYPRRLAALCSAIGTHGTGRSSAWQVRHDCRGLRALTAHMLLSGAFVTCSGACAVCKQAAVCVCVMSRQDRRDGVQVPGDGGWEEADIHVLRG